MSRNRERQQELQPGRVDYARTRLEALGYPVTEVNATTLLLQHEYVVFGEYDLQTINRVTKGTGYYGDIYRNVYIERVKDNPRRNEVTPGVGTQ